MRLGCGCLIGALVVAVLAGGGAWLIFQVLAEPAVPKPIMSAEDALRAQEKIYSILSRSAPRGRPIVLSESELNAFLSRSLDETGETLNDLRVDLMAAPNARIVGKTKLGALLTEPPFAALREVMPASWLARPVWLTFTATAKVVAAGGRRRSLRLDVHEFRAGRQQLPTLLVRLLLDPGALRLLRWSVPETVHGITIEKGQVVVQIAS